MNRTQALCKAFGWQGGTIWQISEETGCEVAELLYNKPEATHLGSDYSLGCCAGTTCSVQFNLETNFPKRKGNLDFWLGVAEGIILDSKLSPLTKK